MTATLVTDTLRWYAKNDACLFPIPHGSKAPFGIVPSFAHDWSRDPNQWALWKEQHNCNFGLVAGPSRLVIVDVDVAEVGREIAWRYWSEWCASHDLPTYAPYCQSARGGWHIAFALPLALDISTLRQCPLVGAIEGVSKKAIIDLRVGNGFVVAAGSYYDGTAKGEASGPYLLTSDAPPHPAPAALLAACSRAVPKSNGVAMAGSRDRGDVAALLLWMTEKDMFSEYSDWLNAGLALKIEYGDDALDLWEITHDNSVTADVIASKWQSFATDPLPGMTTLNSLLSKAHTAGWSGSIRKSTASMFDGVAQLAAATGASLSSGMPTPPINPGMPMMAGQAELARLAAPILHEFLDATTQTPLPAATDFPTLPTAMAGHDLYVPMVAAIGRIIGLSEQPGFKVTADIIRVLIALAELHADVYEAIATRLCLPPTIRSKIKLGAKAFQDDIQRAFVRQDDWIYDARSGLPEHDNPDNVVVFLGLVGCEIRFNMWLEQMEIRGGNDADLHWGDWTYVDDTIVAELRMRALREKTRFKMGKDFAWDALLSLSRKSKVDPVLDTLARLEREWDGTPRLRGWLSRTCGVPLEIYHQTASEIIIGGMVRRIRQPGCKHDFMPVFFGPQGTGKSTIAKIIADMGQSTLAEIDKRSAEWFSDEVMLGDESKELVLSLAGKCLVEIGEMGQRSSANDDHAKAMLSRQVDRGRTAYSRSVTKRPRRNVFFGTVNGDTPLQDTSGNRRFLPVAAPLELNLQWLSDNIKQIIGEAAAMESRSVTFSMPKEVYAIAAEHQEAARSVSDVEARLSEWFALTSFTTSAFVTTTDLAELCDLAGWKSIHTMRNAVMRRLGFKEVLPYISGQKTRGWYRGPDVTPKHVGNVTRYQVSRSGDGRPRVTIRAGGGELPPLPY